MMKTKTFMIITLLVISSLIKAQSQLKVDAGKDTNYCFQIEQYHYPEILQNKFILGALQTIQGGKSPYEINWTMHSKTTGKQCTLLIDSGIQNEINPKVILPYFNPYSNTSYTLEQDSLNDIFIFKITVKDSNQTIVTDSCQIGISRFFNVNSMAFVDNPNFTKIIGTDSIQLDRHTPLGGIAPFKYHWTPEVGLSNPYISSPMAKPQVATMYNLEITDNLGCKAYDFDVFTKTEIINTDYVHFKNPIKNESLITFTSDLLGSTFHIYSENGIELYQTTLKTLNLPLSLIVQTSGIYLYTITNQQGIVITGKMIRE